MILKGIESKEGMMCPKCKYQRICKFTVTEMNKTAANDPCYIFVEMQHPQSATESWDKYLVG